MPQASPAVQPADPSDGGDGNVRIRPNSVAAQGCPQQPCAFLRLSYVLDEADYDEAARRLRALALSFCGQGELCLNGG
jgi:hypothetical protein